jgi:hypothetical protein
MKLFISILGWAWILLGLWWFFRPAGIRKRMAKKYRKTVRWILLVIFFALAGTIYSAGKGLGGLSGTLLFVLAIILLIKGLFLLRGKMSDRILEWWSVQPDSTYRIAAAILFLLGCAIQFVK